MTTVLVVEDETDLAMVLAMNFEAAGHVVVTVPHGAAALSWLEGNRADLVVTDIMMPVLDGRELIRRLRADPATARLPILVLTASLADIEGADAVLTKPTPLPVLRDLIATLLASAGHRPPNGRASRSPAA